MKLNLLFTTFALITVTSLVQAYPSPIYSPAPVYRYPSAPVVTYTTPVYVPNYTYYEPIIYPTYTYPSYYCSYCDNYGCVDCIEYDMTAGKVIATAGVLALSFCLIGAIINS